MEIIFNAVDKFFIGRLLFLALGHVLPFGFLPELLRLLDIDRSLYLCRLTLREFRPDKGV